MSDNQRKEFAGGGMKVPLISYHSIETYQGFHKGRYGSRNGPIGSPLGGLEGPGELRRNSPESAIPQNQAGPCYYCGSLLKAVPDYFQLSSTSEDETGATMGSTFTSQRRLFSCSSCGWWVFHGLSDDYIWPGEGSEGRDYRTLEVLHCGAVREFDLAHDSLPLDSLRSWLARHPNDLAHVNPHAFEKLMAACFKDTHPGAEVIHLGRRSSDGGIDIKLVMSDLSVTLVQVKRRSDLASPEGVDTIYKLNGVLLRENVARGMVVTTARQYTRGAKREATPSVPPLDRYHVDLLAFDDVVSMLRAHATSKVDAWRSFSSEFDRLADYSELHQTKYERLPPPGPQLEELLASLNKSESDD
jgi:hypothetical protein